MSGNVKECPVDGQELALVVENIALREQIGGLTVSDLDFFCLKITLFLLICCFTSGLSS